MANSWNGPQLGSPIRTDVPELQKKLIALLKGDPTSVADIPSGAKRLVNTSGTQWQVQQYNGSSWAAIGKLMHDVDKLDGYDAAITPAASTVAVRNADKKLEGDITGNAATASSAATLSETLPVNKGGTGATTSAAARTNLGVPPTSHASSSTTYGLGTDTNYGHVRSDGDTTKIVAGEVVVKDVAIGGDVSNLASKRGQIGDIQRITVKYPNFSDFDDVKDNGEYFCMTADMSAANAPSTLGGTLRVIAYNGWKYVKQIFYIYRTNGVLQRFYNGDNTTTPWSPWISIITQDSLATTSTPGIVKPGTGMTVDAAGALNVNASSASIPGLVKSSTSAAAGAVPLGGEDGCLDKSWTWEVGEYRVAHAESMDGGLLCNGAAVSRTTYNRLFAKIGTKFGKGDGETTFNLPDFRNRTLWGAGNNLGAVIEAGLPGIYGTFGEGYLDANNMPATGAFGRKSGGPIRISGTDVSVNVGTYTFDASKSSDKYGKSNTVQPPAIAVNVFIKY